MRKKSFPIILVTICIALLQGCALFDKHLFTPAASHARINPLFRTADCKFYLAADGRDWYTSTRNMSSIFFKDRCEHQTLSINDIADGSTGAGTAGTTGTTGAGTTGAGTAGTTGAGTTGAADTGATVTVDKDYLYSKLCATDASGIFVNGSGGASNCINYLISKSDEICTIHKSHIYGDRTAMNTLLGTLALGAGVAGTMTGVGVTHYLAGSAGFITGGQALMNNEIYRNFVSNAILLEIDDNRKEFLGTLSYLAGDANTQNVGLGKVRSDAMKYHSMCSFYEGLASLLNKAGDKTNITSNPAVQQLISKKTKIEQELSKLRTDFASLPTPITPKDIDFKSSLDKKIRIKEEEINMINNILVSVTAPAPAPAPAPVPVPAK